MKELDELNERFHNSDEFLGVDVLTITNKVDSVRGSMLSNMLQQTVCIDHSEPPRVFTRYENQVGKYSSSYYRNNDNDYKNLTTTWDPETRKLSNTNITEVAHPKKVVAVIPKIAGYHNYVTYVVYDTVDKIYDIIERKIAEKLTENYCYLYDNTIIDSKHEEDLIAPEEVLYHSTNFDSEMNYGYGMNVPACYMINNDTIEDAVPVSETLAYMMSFNYMHEVEITINTNDLLINLYGDKKTYKSFPDINEPTLGNVLTARRRVKYDNALFDLKDEQMMNINYNSDKVFYVSGTLVDIDIDCTTSLDLLRQYHYNDQIV